MNFFFLCGIIFSNWGDKMVKKRRINHKSIYKLCYTQTDKNRYNYKLAISLSTGVVGATLMQNMYGYKDTGPSMAIKLIALSIAFAEFYKLARQESKRLLYNNDLKVLIHDILTRNMSCQEYEENRDKYISIEYWNEIERLFYKYKTSADFDNDVFTFILELENNAKIKEVITNDDYKCYYVDKEKEEDITNLVKISLRRKN